MTKTKPLLIAHRGDTVSFPENTLEAFVSAFDKGADGIEMDIHLHEGAIIIVHNFLFDHSKNYPKLVDVLPVIHNRGRIEIEIKAFRPDILQPLQDILAQFPQTDFELTTSEIPLAAHIKKTFPKIPVGLILHEFLFPDWMTSDIACQKMLGWGTMVGVDRIHINLQTLNQFGQAELVAKLHQAGFEIHSHIINDEAQEKTLQHFIDWQVDQCTIDNVALSTLK
ncbi:glycerophosphodiester phosphodiesterase [Candidatus Beckwithbacteria bacterium]|nr:glycerophosphodiester phosphodiesterase [Candidatus Beckwithbacteria bacterium]